ncbi:MAG: hypothetical protein H6835_08560 [Planctomycetes bacterium]|nr:hypothetical protein [Planctomycetota bacterium]
MPANLAALIVGLALLLAAASRQLVHCTSGDGSTRLELQRDALGCHGPNGCDHDHDAPTAPRCCGHDHELEAGRDPAPGEPTADCGSTCQHVPLTIDLANGPRVELPTPPPPAATPPPPPLLLGSCAPRAAHSAPPTTGPPRPPGWLVHRAAVVLQL